MIDCIHCGQAPERRESGDRVMYICPVCNHRGVASTTEAWASESWNQANRGDLASCCSGAPPRFKQSAEKWWACCTGCRHAVGGYMSLPGALAGWSRSLR